VRLESRWKGLVVVVAVLALVGCPAGPTYVVQQYPGPQRAQETISILRVNGKDNVRIGALDSEEITARIAEDVRLHLELLPGHHALLVKTGEAYERVSFDAEAGKVYRVILDAPPSGPNPTPGNAHVHEVDRDSDAVGRDVTAGSP
jgi:hypothetical protein